MEAYDGRKKSLTNMEKHGGESLLKGIGARAGLTDCPLNAFKVIVTKCSGEGECAAICMVSVFQTGAKGECIVTNGALCMGCMACVAQCTENGVMVIPNDPKEYLSTSELLK